MGPGEGTEAWTGALKSGENCSQEFPSVKCMEPPCRLHVGWQGGVEEVVVVSGLKAGGSACGGYFAINMASSTRR